MGMEVQKVGLSLRVNADPQRPYAEQDYLITGIDPATEFENQVTSKLMSAADWSTSFFVPNEESFTPTMFEIFAVKAGVISLEFLSSTKAKATVIYRPQEIASAKSAGGNDPNQQANESNETANDVLGPSYEFSTQGGTRHITQSIKTVFRGCYDSFGAVAEAPFLQNVIGLSGDGVEGCDVVASDMRWSVTQKNCRLTQTYRRNAQRLTGTVNSNAFTAANGALWKFFLHDKGECLFLGMNASHSRADGWVCTWFFQSRENERSTGSGSSNGVKLIPEGNGRPPITVAEKLGHDYVWHHYERDEIAGFTVMKPSSVYIEQVYPFDNEMNEIGVVNGVFDDTGEKLTLDYLFREI